MRHLHESGFPLDVLSIVGRDIQETEEPIGVAGRGDYAKAGAETGALGWLIGLCIGAAFLILPGLGLVVVAGPIAASLMAAMEGGVAGTLVGSLAGSSSPGECRGIGRQVRDAGQGRQVSHPRPVHRGDRRPRRGAYSPPRGRST